MAALTDNKEVNKKDGLILSMPVVASDIIYKGALVKSNAAGYLAPCASEAGSFFAGVAYEKADNSSGSAGDIECRVEVKGVFLLEGTGFGQGDVGSLVYASDDQTITKTDSGDLQLVGRIVQYVSSTNVYVELMSSASILGDVIEADEVTLAENKILIGNASGVAEASSDEISHYVVFAGEFTTAGGDAAEVITVTGALATDLAFVQLKTEGASPVTVDAAAAATDAINVTMSADPSNDHVLVYQVLRAI